MKKNDPLNTWLIRSIDVRNSNGDGFKPQSAWPNFDTCTRYVTLPNSQEDTVEDQSFDHLIDERLSVFKLTTFGSHFPCFETVIANTTVARLPKHVFPGPFLGHGLLSRHPNHNSETIGDTNHDMKYSNEFIDSPLSTHEPVHLLWKDTSLRSISSCSTCLLDWFVPPRPWSIDRSIDR